ncbi:SGNH/GDSL hydrolase family protein [Priestia megaterium]|uniref:SGNH/GDSL hydrolase family protein n=1 Tax=Priestia megaterium TaxID=1404 RepID=UPI001C24F297|nr:SGNH/GDSL hydrolase family protein [Priestia megaterium]MBU8686457.1 SGNH/GDSL hydrolase family protein [Priestia megaterium]
MKVWINIIAIITLIATIVAGKMYWDQKIEAEGVARPTAVNSSSASASSSSWKSDTNNLPASIVKKLEKAEQTGKPVKLVIVGSQDTSTDSSAWPAHLEEKLTNTYGLAIEVEVQEYKDKNSLEFVREKLYEKVIEAKPDVLLFEPFLANDNGTVGITNTLDNINLIMTHINENVDDLVTIIQPSHPIYHAVNYPKEADQLKAFAKKHDYEYINHWSEWPDSNSESLLSYLTESKTAPSEKGNTAWAKALELYFTNSK